MLAPTCSVAALAPMARCLCAASRRGVATYAIRQPQEAVLRELWQEDSFEHQLPSQRDATAAIARRQQWQTLPFDCPKTMIAAMQEPCNEARIITEIAYPHRVVFANHAWEHLCGWSADEVKDRHGLAFLQGDKTDRVKVQLINSAVRHGERAEVRLVNYKKDGTPFINRLRITPLRSRPGEYTHMLGILEEVPGSSASATTAAARPAAVQQ